MHLDVYICNWYKVSQNLISIAVSKFKLSFIFTDDFLLIVVISLLECLVTQHQSIGPVAYDQVGDSRDSSD